MMFWQTRSNRKNFSSFTGSF
ncbi:hypothetical protein CGLO_04044 [Colletotrichum gloeosporioides Cg-14]|uniref:Uncharacterized protein n=1 Tax=Colletotrichum gloeosporioides (strain Cg-14) TaxID=1237896 RepID=T0LWB8_COLGC|nr:hypothetical protein CGLO_04044 [Colletotrichum gloeosporioides Cg-14]